MRLHYVYPYPRVDEVIPLMADNKILPYLDVPLQHSSPRILKLMKRPADAENTLKRIQYWRSQCPQITIRSTFIVGFPGETEAEFEQLLGFLSEAQLDRVGCFAYSPVQGAAANGLPDPVPEQLREERRARFMQHQQHISAEKLRSKVGSVQTVLLDAVDNQRAVGRSSADAPEIDGVVHVTGTNGLRAGEFANVRITDADEYDLFANTT